MTVTEIHKEGKTNSIKLHCETCPKILDSFDNEFGEIALMRMALVRGLADSHQRHHPDHNMTIYITKWEFPAAKDMRERLENGRK